MKIIILAAGQGTRLRPLTDEKPKCMVEVNNKSILEYQLSLFRKLGIREKDIYVLTGYRNDVIKKYLINTDINIIDNVNYEKTNMVCTLMCARDILYNSDDIVISYGDIIYTQEVFEQLLNAEDEASVIVDQGWYAYWKLRNDNPLDDAETLIKDADNNLIEIGQKTDDIANIQAQYIGLMRFKNNSIKQMLEICKEAENRSQHKKPLWRTNRTYDKMYMTDLLQGMIDEGAQLKAVEINRGWYEIDCVEDLKIAEKELVDTNKDVTNSYYGGKEGDLLSYLEFGSINIKEGKKTIWGYWQHQQAYDLYMFSRYAKDLFLFRDFVNQEKTDINAFNECIKCSAHDKIMDYIFKYAGMLTVINNNIKKPICESGSSLYGLIDETIATDVAFNKGKNKAEFLKLQYLCSDLSEMMNRGAAEFHHGTDFEFSTADTIDKLLDEKNEIGMFYGLSVSLRYALRTAKDLLKIALCSDFAIFNRISLSFDKTLVVPAGTGKYSYVISIEEFIKYAKDNGVYVQYNTSNMQHNKDGNDTIRISLVMSKDRNLIEEYIGIYKDCISKASEIHDVKYGEWKNIEMVYDEKK